MKNLLVYVCIALNLIITAFTVFNSVGSGVRGFVLEGSEFSRYVAGMDFVLNGIRFEVLKPGVFVNNLNKKSFTLWYENPMVIRQYYKKLLDL